MSTLYEPRQPVPLANLFKGAHQALAQLDGTVGAALDPKLAELIKIRASQINGCAYCLDLHTADALALGETAARLTMVPTWREATNFTDQERAALALTEEITLIAEGHVAPEVEDFARSVFDEATYAAVVFAVIVINAWNRMAITGHNKPTHFNPGDRKK